MYHNVTFTASVYQCRFSFPHTVTITTPLSCWLLLACGAVCSWGTCNIVQLGYKYLATHINVIWQIFHTCCWIRSDFMVSPFALSPDVKWWLPETLRMLDLSEDLRTIDNWFDPIVEELENRSSSEFLNKLRLGKIHLGIAGNCRSKFLFNVCQINPDWLLVKIQFALA